MHMTVTRTQCLCTKSFFFFNKHYPQVFVWFIF